MVLTHAASLLALTSAAAAVALPQTSPNPAYPDFFTTPLVTHIYTADPSAHVFEGRVYVYPSHDRIPQQENPGSGNMYDMVDYHVLSLPKIPGPVTDHGVVLALADIPWASRQLWAPDAAHANGKYYLYFPAKDKDNIFRMGVAISDKPSGPFTPDPSWIPNSYSIDPAAYVDTDGSAYLYFGGIHGGQLQCWNKPHAGEYKCPEWEEPNSTVLPALLPRMAKLSKDMRSFESEVKEIRIEDENGDLLIANDHDRRFFEGPWVHKYKGKYYFSYSTGTTHYLVYAVGDSPWGPFTYQGKILDPVEGWTTHHSIVEVDGKWYLFYHDAAISGESHLRNVRVREIFYDSKGRIRLTPEGKSCKPKKKD